MGLIVATANFYLTNAGKAAALDAANNSIDIEMTQIALGTAKYDAQVTAPTQTALTTEVGRYNLVGGGSSGQVLRLTTTLTPNYTAEIFEIGLFLSDGTLFAVAAVTGTDPLMQTANGLTNVITLGCSLAEVGSNVTVSVDANSPIAVVLMNQHLDHPDPHPQYSKKIDTDAALLALKVTTITAGAGLTGGGDLSGNRTITLGTPSTITGTTTNSVTADSHTHELGDGSVTDAKITSVSASKITGVIPAANLPPASATVNVVDNLNSNSANDALSANQGRVLDQNKLNKSGGTVSGNLTIKGQTYARALWIQSNANNSNVAISIDSTTNQVLFQHSPISGAGGFKFDKKLEAASEIKSKTLKVDNGNNVTTFSHQIGGGKSLIQTDCNVFEMNRLLYMGTNTYNRATNGYSYLPNGVLLQWGRYDTTVIEGGVNVTFPIAFPNACLNVTATRMASVAVSTNADGGVHYVSSTTNEAVFNLQGFYGDSKGTLRGFTWMAIGY